MRPLCFAVEGLAPLASIAHPPPMEATAPSMSVKGWQHQQNNMGVSFILYHFFFQNPLSLKHINKGLSQNVRVNPYLIECIWAITTPNKTKFHLKEIFCPKPLYMLLAYVIPSAAPSMSVKGWQHQQNYWGIVYFYILFHFLKSAIPKAY